MRLRRVVVFMVIICSVIAGRSAAQEGNRITVSGTITDPSGAVVSGATLSLHVLRCKCSDCNPQADCNCCPDQLTGQSNEAGRYSFTVPHGTYHLDVKAGSREAHIDVDLSDGRVQHQDIGIE